MYEGETFKHCYDDRYCKVYGDCCRDSDHYVESEQTARVATGVVYNNSRYGCYRVDGAGLVALMIGECPRTVDRGVFDRCAAGNTSTDYPVTSLETGHMYRNAYCAWCHGERRRVVYWKPAFTCHGSDGRTRNASLEDAINLSILHRDGRWYYADYEAHELITCKFQLLRPDAEAPPPRSCGTFRSTVGLVDGCPVGTSETQARACASYTSTVFDDGYMDELRIFRNVDCARCNGVTATQLNCLPPPPVLLSTLHFESMLKVRSAIPCAPEEFYDVLATKCRNVFRDELSNKCRSFVSLEPSEYDFRSMDNETVYVYTYRKRIRHRGGSPLEVCAEDAALDGVEDGEPAYASFLAIAGMLGSCASFVGLVAHLALFCCRAKPKNLPEKNLASLSVSLLLGYGGFLAITLHAVRPGSGTPCLASALAMHYGFLSAFAWMSVMSADLWITLHSSTKKLRVAGGKRTGRFAAYSAFAWLAPGALTVLAAVLQLTTVYALPSDLRPNFQHDCWFRNPRSLIALFVLPTGATVVANYVSFAGAVRLIVESTDSWSKSMGPTGRSRNYLKIYVRMSLMMGLAWAFGLAGAITDSEVVWTLHTVLNSLHGAFVFLAFDCDWSALIAITKRPLPQSETQTTTAASPVSGSN